MKSPDALSLRLKRQWENADKREARLLDGESAWPIEVSIGRPKPSSLVDDLDSVRSHIERWRQVSIGEVVWQAVRIERLPMKSRSPCLGNCVDQPSGSMPVGTAVCEPSLNRWGSVRSGYIGFCD